MTARDLEEKAREWLAEWAGSWRGACVDSLTALLESVAASARAEGAGEERARVVAICERHATRHEEAHARGNPHAAGAVIAAVTLRSVILEGDHCPAPPAENGTCPCGLLHAGYQPGETCSCGRKAPAHGG